MVFETGGCTITDLVLCRPILKMIMKKLIALEELRGKEYTQTSDFMVYGIIAF